MRQGLAEALRSPGVRGAVVAVALLTSLDDIEEYFPLLARDSGVTTAANPGVVVALTLCGAAGAWLAGRWTGPGTRVLTAALSLGVLALAVPLAVAHPGGLAGVAAFYGLYRCVLVLAEARLQARIDGRARATVTSVAGLGTDLAGLLVFGAWALAGLPAMVVLGLVVVAVLPWGLRPDPV